MDTGEHIAIEERSGFLWVKLPDAISMDNSAVVEEAIRSRLTGENDRVVLDLTDTAYLYSSGIGLMIRMHKAVASTGGGVYLVNVSRPLRNLLEGMHLDKVFPLYATDVEFEISREELWKERGANHNPGFIFAAQPESGIYRITVSGQLDALHDLSALDKFEPEERVSHYLLDLRDLDVMDTYGSQTFLDFLQRIQSWGGKCVTYGANDMVRELMNLLSMDDLMEHCATEREALESLRG
jgi:anti-anti-sigma factor